ncbi:TROVE domain-containing protein [Meiothermus ruber]|uniref:TROVE domain-containing protein n=1 Tax=Meiothermus ruber TaxID=277 RepID=UPI00055BA121|nr:TROVE domain-containing protein [Meiothermus ruber]MCL6530325.1 TROVE domain-containing protein [Meiothermus ruber]
MSLTFTYEGGLALVPTAHAEFLALALNWLPGNTFYEGETERQQRYLHLSSSLLLHDPAFVADLAAYSRQILGLRTVGAYLVGTLFLAGSEVSQGLGYPGEARSLAFRAARAVWRRGDEHLQTLGHLAHLKLPLPKGLRKAVKAHLEALPPRQLLKYKQVSPTALSEGFSQRDAIRLVHPRPRTQESEAVFRYLLGRAGPMEIALVERMRQEAPTWEALLSAQGSTPEVWRGALPRMKALALVRNLRNCLEAGLSLEELLPNAERVDVRDLFPHQLFRAYQEASPALPLLDRLFHRMVEARPPMKDTLVLLDVSGSMCGTPLAQAAPLAVALALKGGIIVPFDSVVRPAVLPGESPIQTVGELLRLGGGGTCLGQAVDYAAYQAAEEGYRRLVVITDEQAHDDALLALRRFLKGGTRRQAHVINLVGYAPSVVSPHPRLHRHAGFNPRLLDFLPLVEGGGEAVRGFLERWEREAGLEGKALEAVSGEEED